MLSVLSNILFPICHFSLQSLVSLSQEKRFVWRSEEEEEEEEDLTMDDDEGDDDYRPSSNRKPKV